ncbi:MAG: FecR domain-containing protein [Prolixibacteraceae bacterium]
MLNYNEIEQIERYISGTADNNEIAFVESLFANGKQNFGLCNHMETEWESGNHCDVPSEALLNSMLDRVHHLIRNKEDQKRKLFVHRFVRTFSKVAAILLLPLLLTGGLTIGYLLDRSNPISEQSASSVIHAPMGSRVSFSLPDGTKGFLNSGSSLTYSIPFASNRNVALDGEAWFDVTHDQNHPFEISVGTSKVKVLGTSFNVSAYQEAQYIEVVLQQGKVEFYQDNQSENVTMTPSQRLVCSNGKVEVTTTDPAKYQAWTEGKLVFRGDNMAEVARRIERWYNVKVILADRDLDSYSFRATFEDDSLEEVLRLLGKTSPIDYKIAPLVLKSDETIEKVVVSLYKRVGKKNINQKSKI